MTQPTFTDPATGRPYVIDPATGGARWADRPQPAARPHASPAKNAARRWLIPLGTGILGLIVGTASAGGGDAGATTAGGAATTQTVTAAAETVTAPAPAAAPAAKAPVAAGPATTIPGDGTFEVGVDVKPGRYKSAKPTSGMCYWSRLKDDSGQMGDIIANNVGAGPSVVTIKATDKVFETKGCEDWVKS